MPRAGGYQPTLGHTLNVRQRTREDVEDVFTSSKIVRKNHKGQMQRSEWVVLTNKAPSG